MFWLLYLIANLLGLLVILIICSPGDGRNAVDDAVMSLFGINMLGWLAHWFFFTALASPF